MTKEDWAVFIPKAEDPLNDDERVEAIADALEAGNPSPMFCQYLAGMIRKNGKNATPWRFNLVHKKTGRPKTQLDPVALEMERLVDGERVPIDEAICRVQQQFGRKGNSKRKCEGALQKARESTRLARFLDETTKA